MYHELGMLMYGLCLMICTLNSFITSSLLNKEEQLGPELYRIPSGVWTRFLTLRGTGDHGGNTSSTRVLCYFRSTLWTCGYLHVQIPDKRTTIELCCYVVIKI